MLKYLGQGLNQPLLTLLGIKINNNIVRIIKVVKQIRGGNFEMWVPFTSARWNTDDRDIDLLLKWASSEDRVCGRKGHGPDITGCTAQSLLAVQHDFRRTDVLTLLHRCLDIIKFNLDLQVQWLEIKVQWILHKIHNLC